MCLTVDRATQVAIHLGLEFALIHRGKRQQNGVDWMLVGNVQEKTVVLIDDIADTSHTITRAAQLLKERGCSKVYAIVTHAVLSGDAIERIKESCIDQFVASTSVPQAPSDPTFLSKFKLFDIAPLFAEAIRRIHNGESISYLFDTNMTI